MKLTTVTRKERIEPLTERQVQEALFARGEAPDVQRVERILVAIRPVDRAIAELIAAGDVIISDASDRRATLPSAQADAFAGVLGSVIEHTDTLLYVRGAMVSNTLALDDEDVPALIALASGIAASIHQAART